MAGLTPPATGSLEEQQPRRVVVTGVGVVSPGGIGKEAFWQSLSRGCSSVTPIRHLEPKPGQRVHIAASVDAFSVSDYAERRQSRFMERVSGFAFAAAKMALQDASLDLATTNLERMGTSIGTFAGAIGMLRSELNRVSAGGIRKLNALGCVIGNPSAVFGNISIHLKLRGPCVAIYAAETAGADAIGYAYRQIQYDQADVMIAGGSEAPIVHSLLFTFDSLGLLSRRNEQPECASRPFDGARDGFVLGEGAGVVVLEEMTHALRRGAHIYAELAGYAATFSPPNGNLSQTNSSGATRAMQLALEDAGLCPDDVDCVSAHASSMTIGDRLETQAIKQVLGERAYAVPVSSIKSMVGHALGAAGGMQAVASVLSIEQCLVPPTINYKKPDSLCDLDYVPNQARQTIPDVVVQNSFSFLGKNSVLVHQRWRGERRVAS